MTDRELMQMALDALEAMQSYARAEKKGLRICDESIEALRERLAIRGPELCCQKYETCTESCTPRGRYLARREWAGITWVGLTHEERDEIDQNCRSQMEALFSIEAKLKEKNT